LGEFHEIAVRVADRGDLRLLAEVCWRVAQRDPAVLQPRDHAGQVEDHESQLDRAGAARPVLRVVLGGMDCEVHVAQLAAPVRLGLTVPLLKQRKTKHVTVELRHLPGLAGDEDQARHEPQALRPA
jgi:hypothetical protein